MSNQTSVCYKKARRRENWHTAQNTGIVQQRTLYGERLEVVKEFIYLCIYLGVKLESWAERGGGGV